VTLALLLARSSLALLVPLALRAQGTQGRSYENDGSAFGDFNVHGSAHDLYAIHPDNTFLIKASYWFSL
jgi:hypothetical protein